MIIASHVVEDLVSASAGAVTLVSCFQQPRFWKAEQARYASLAQRATVVAVSAQTTAPPIPPPGVSQVELEQDHPFISEWFVLALGPGMSVTLCGLDLQRVNRDGEREFDTIFSVDPAVAERAVAFVTDVLADRISTEGQPKELVGRPTVSSASEVAQQADQLLGGMLLRMDRMRQREHAANRSAARLHELAQSAEERERHRLAEALHDDTLQILMAAGQDLEEIKPLDSEDPALAAATRNLRRGLHGLRQTLRAVQLNLSSDDLQSRLATMAPLIGERGGFTTDLHVDPNAAARQDEQVVSLVREALINATKHAQADRVSIDVDWDEPTQRIVVRIADDGVGAEPDQLQHARASGHIGLMLAHERITAAHGTWNINTAPGRGFTLTATLPAQP